jgi:hypothetical protein
LEAGKALPGSFMKLPYHFHRGDSMELGSVLGVESQAPPRPRTETLTYKFWIHEMVARAGIESIDFIH